MGIIILRSGPLNIIVLYGPNSEQVDWAVNEGMPQCPSGLQNVSLLTSYERGETVVQTAHFMAL